jgi:flagellar basal-body rod modification protein FlgD
MAIDALGSVATSSTALANAGISQDQFLKILLTQLRFQDPLKPMDNEQFVAQLAQFSALEVNREQSDKIDSLLSMQAASQAVTLIGKSVELGGANGGQIGTVIAISFSSGTPLLSVKTAATTLTGVSLSNVSLITNSNSDSTTPPVPPVPPVPGG